MHSHRQALMLLQEQEDTSEATEHIYNLTIDPIQMAINGIIIHQEVTTIRILVEKVIQDGKVVLGINKCKIRQY